ncbi:WD40 repeat domain-containing protein [Singulisphaera sp. PoT]|uniref:WD40 repeat domain-containing protein n=1 Tax=Singulisphaera sp. PoT TaxID=3411797 RepID=UPI003BF51DC5
MWRQAMGSAEEFEPEIEPGRPRQAARFIQVGVITPGVFACLLMLAAAISGVQTKRDKLESESTRLDADRSIKACDGLILGTSFSADGRTVAIAGSDGSLKLWDVFSGRVRIVPQEISTRNLAFSPDGRLLATTHTNHDVNLYDPASGSLLYSLESPRLVRHLAFDPRGDSLATGDSEGDITLWDLNTQRPRRVLADENSVPGSSSLDTRLVSMTYAPDGKTLIVGRGDGSVRVCDVEAGTTRGVWQVHSTPIDALAVSPDGALLATATCLEDEVKLWDLSTGDLQKTIRVEDRGVKKLDFASEGTTLTTAGASNNFRIWDVATGTMLKRLHSSDGWVWALSYSPDGDWLISGGADGVVGLWQMRRASGGVRIASREVQG